MQESSTTQQPATVSPDTTEESISSALSESQSSSRTTSPYLFEESEPSKENIAQANNCEADEEIVGPQVPDVSSIDNDSCIKQQRQQLSSNVDDVEDDDDDDEVYINHTVAVVNDNKNNVAGENEASSGIIVGTPIATSSSSKATERIDNTKDVEVKGTNSFFINSCFTYCEFSPT